MNSELHFERKIIRQAAEGVRCPACVARIESSHPSVGDVGGTSVNMTAHAVATQQEISTAKARRLAGAVPERTAGASIAMQDLNEVLDRLPRRR